MKKNTRKLRPVSLDAGSISIDVRMNPSKSALKIEPRLGKLAVLQVERNNVSEREMLSVFVSADSEGQYFSCVSFPDANYLTIFAALYRTKIDWSQAMNIRTVLKRARKEGDDFWTIQQLLMWEALRKKISFSCTGYSAHDIGYLEFTLTIGKYVETVVMSKGRFDQNIS